MTLFFVNKLEAAGNKAAFFDLKARTKKTNKTGTRA